MTIERLYHWYSELCDYAKLKPTIVDVEMDKEDMEELLESIARVMSDKMHNAISGFHIKSDKTNIVYVITVNSVTFNVTRSEYFKLQIGSISMMHNRKQETPIKIS